MVGITRAALTLFLFSFVAFYLLEVLSSPFRLLIWGLWFFLFTILVAAVFTLKRLGFSAIGWTFISIALLIFACYSSPDYRLFPNKGPSNQPTTVFLDLIISKYGDFGSISRGDMVELTQDDVLYRKRVHGVPGDKVIVCNLVALVNGSYYSVKNDWEPRKLTTPDICNIRYQTFQLEHDEYFVLGDNLSDSTDSRTFGLVSEKNIIGKSIYVISGSQLIKGEWSYKYLSVNFESQAEHRTEHQGASR